MSRPKKNSARILVVDDSALNREMLNDMLSDDYDIIEAANGEEALNILKEHVYDIDLVLLDIIMPVVDGFGVLDVMKRYHWTDDTPVIMISTETSQTYARLMNSALQIISADRSTVLLSISVFQILLCCIVSRKNCSAHSKSRFMRTKKTTA